MSKKFVTKGERSQKGQRLDLKIIVFANKADV